MFSNSYPMIMGASYCPRLPPALDMTLDHGLTCNNADSTELLSASADRSAVLSRLGICYRVIGRSRGCGRSPVFKAGDSPRPIELGHHAQAARRIPKAPLNVVPRE
jgi:hypothetical protein